MKEQEVFISDIHGHYDEFEKALSYWESNTQGLNLLGDYMDRGTQNVKVLRKVKDLVENYGATAIRGNHDQLFLDYIDNPTDNHNIFLYNGGLETVHEMTDYKYSSLVLIEDKETNVQAVKQIKENYKEEINFLRGLPLYIEHENIIGVHAGVDHDKWDEWKETSDTDFMWLREFYFLRQENRTGKLIVSGHTPTILRGQEDGTVLDIGCNRYMIDGGVFHTGHLNMLVLNKDGSIERAYKVSKERTECV